MVWRILKYLRVIPQKNLRKINHRRPEESDRYRYDLIIQSHFEPSLIYCNLLQKKALNSSFLNREPSIVSSLVNPPNVSSANISISKSPYSEFRSNNIHLHLPSWYLEFKFIVNDIELNLPNGEMYYTLENLYEALELALTSAYKKNYHSL